MAEKKNQHLVPACYLRNFEANISDKIKINPKYTSGIYVNDNRLSAGWKLKSVTHKSLTKPYFYNLPEDDPKQPIVENYLSVVEGEYATYVKQIIEGAVNNDNMSFMSYFVMVQFMRVESFIDEFQGAWDKIAGWMDEYEGKNDYEIVLKDISKRLLVSSDFGHLIHQHSAIIYNKTNFPFITSDNPVVRKQLNIQDALKIIPKRHLLEIEDESLEFACFFLPVSPNVAYVSCELIKNSDNLFYSNCDLENVFYLNYFSIKNSYAKIYSSIIEPIKGETELVKYLTTKNQTIIKIYTYSKRIICSGTIENNSNFSLFS